MILVGMASHKLIRITTLLVHTFCFCAGVGKNHVVTLLSGCAAPIKVVNEQIL